MRKLGLIAGGGDLPVELAARCEAAGRAFAVMRLRSFADPSLSRYPGVEVGIGEFGKVFKALRSEGCEVVCFAGQVSRPDFAAMMPDGRGLKVLPSLIVAARKGDDALLRRVLDEFEKEGFDIEWMMQQAGLTQPAPNTPGTLGLGISGSAVPPDTVEER